MSAADNSTRGGRSAVRTAVPWGLAVLGAIGVLAAAASVAAALDPDAPATVAEIDALVAQLGDPDYAVREVAGGRLSALGAEAADALLTAAETSTDLEVSLRAPRRPPRRSRCRCGSRSPAPATS